MSIDPVVNFGKVTVSTGYSSSATSIVLNSGNGAKLPASFPFNLIWWNATDYADPADDPGVEIVTVTAIATDTLTVTRAQEGTSASSKNASGKTYKMVQGPTAKTIADLGGLSGFRNKLRNSSLSQWYSGTSGTAPTTAGTSNWTAEGVYILPTGASVAWSQIANPLTNPLSYWALKIAGATSNTGFTARFVIGSLDAAPLAGQTCTFQLPTLNKVGASVTPTITVKYAGSQDVWSSPTTDSVANGANMQTVTNSGQQTLAFTWACNANAIYGMVIDIAFPAMTSSSNYIVIGGGFDCRATAGVSTGANSSPPSPEIRNASVDARWCKTFYQTSYPNGTAVGANIGMAGMVPGGASANLGSTWYGMGMGWEFPVEMWSSPTLSVFDALGNSGCFSFYWNNAEHDDTAYAGTFSISAKGVMYKMANADAGGVAPMFHFAADARIAGA
jgi:hypothetical protein